MVNRCVAAGCSNTPSDRVSLFKDRFLRNQWEKQVQRTRAQWKATDHSYLCSEHFTEACFEADSALAAQFGIKKRRRLKADAVPTIFPRPSKAQAVVGEKGSSRKRKAQISVESSTGLSSSMEKRAAVVKRERREVLSLNVCDHSVAT